ncbi:hypothetical protein [Acutalibacter sp. 1XD8-36]|nr:hypothetical protein [Acutalibacter sp. 1XD8-36]
MAVSMPRMMACVPAERRLFPAAYESIKFNTEKEEQSCSKT